MRQKTKENMLGESSGGKQFNVNFDQLANITCDRKKELQLDAYKFSILKDINIETIPAIEGKMPGG
jgi:hypothetical protein